MPYKRKMSVYLGRYLFYLFTSDGCLGFVQYALYFTLLQGIITTKKYTVKKEFTSDFTMDSKTHSKKDIR